MYTIDKNIPIPSHMKQAKYPWEKMNIGDSFFVPNKTKSFHATVYSRNVKKRGVFTGKLVDGGFRVWRTA